jgi:hypothetical protein
MVDENRNKEDRVRMQIADSNLVIEADLAKMDGPEPQNPG